MNAIKKWLYIRSLKSQKATMPATQGARSWKDIQTIGLLFDASLADTRKWASTTTEKWRREGKQVSILAFAPDSRPESNLPFPHFTKKDINLYGRSDSSFIREFIAKPHHLVVCPEPQLTPALQFILTVSNADVKAGYHNELKDTAYNLSIDLPATNNHDQLVKELVHILSRFTQKDSAHERTT